MSLYDVIDEIAEKQITKTETGDTRIFGVVLGTVAKNYDKDMGGRVCVTVPTRDKNANELLWARVAQPSSGKKWGHYFLPEVGDQVLLAFDGGNIEKPYVIGSVPLDKNKFLRNAADKDNQFKRIITRHGSMIEFCDSSKSDDGSKDSITIQTGQKALTFVLDNENQVVRITDKSKKNQIQMNTADGNGKLTIKAANSLTIQVGDTIKVRMNGETGSVSIEANDLKIKASKSLKLQTDGVYSAEGATFTQKASSVMKSESSGMVNISGSPIKIG